MDYAKSPILFYFFKLTFKQATCAPQTPVTSEVYFKTTPNSLNWNTHFYRIHISLNIAINSDWEFFGVCVWNFFNAKLHVLFLLYLLIKERVKLMSK